MDATRLLLRAFNIKYHVLTIKIDTAERTGLTSIYGQYIWAGQTGLGDLTKCKFDFTIA
jgi:hypothetical protein